MASRRPARWLVVVAVMLPTTLEGLSTFTVSVALDHLRGALAAGPDEVSWVLTAHIVAYSLMLPLTDWLSSLVGRRRLFFYSTLLFTISSAAAGVAPTLPLLIAARVLQGLAGGTLIPISQTLMMETFSTRRRAMAIAIWSMGVAAGAIAGPALGGWLTERWDWRWIFTFNVPLGLLALPLVRLALVDLPAPATHPSPKVRPDLAGLLYLVVGIGALQAMLEWGGRDDWFRSPRITWLALLALVGLLLFVRQEVRTPAPNVSLAVFKNRAFTTGTLLMAVAGCCQSSAVVLSCLYAERVMGYTALDAGLVLAPAGLATAAAMLLAGAIHLRVGSRPVMVAGGLLSAAGMFQLTGLTPEATYGQLVWPRVVVGLGFGLLFVSLATSTLSALSAVQARRAAGLFNLLRNVGSGVGLALFRAFLERGAQTHHARLVEGMEPYREQAAQKLDLLTGAFIARGADAATAQQQAWVTLHGATRKQAWYLSFLDSYELLAAVLLISIPFLFLLRPPGRAAALATPGEGGR